MNHYLDWHALKNHIENNRIRPHFKERQIWYLSIGINIGTEQNGKNTLFERPVLILKKFNTSSFWGIPATSKSKKGVFYYSINTNKSHYCFCLSQLRLFDIKRAQRLHDYLSFDQLNTLQKKITTILQAKTPH